jgi:hypothetical protein
LILRHGSRRSQTAALVSKLREHPVAFALDIFERRVGQDKGALGNGFQFNEAGDVNVADLPAIYG